jgi:hypothetical protein
MLRNTELKKIILFLNKQKALNSFETFSIYSGGLIKRNNFHFNTTNYN